MTSAIRPALIERARAVAQQLPLEELAAAGIARDRANYFLNISYPSLQAMRHLAPSDGLFAARFPSAPLAPAAVYIHVPFCTALCYYCHYYKLFKRPPEDVDNFLGSVERELDLLTAKYGSLRAASVYVGGGTPSYMEPRQIRRLFKAVRGVIDVESAAEITFEVHPESSDAARLDALMDAGVTRVNLGVESLVDHVLALENRRHSVSDVENAVERIQSTGFQTYNLDLIYGLRDQQLPEWNESLDGLAELAPPSATLYYLRLKRKTPETSWFHREPHRFPSADDLLLMHIMNFERMEADLGYIQRPVDWFIKSESHFHTYQDHNWARTDETPLIGIGPSAYSYVHGWQYYNVNDLSRYAEMLCAGQLPWWRGEYLTGDEPMRRSIMLGIKNRIDRSWFRSIYGVDPVQAFPAEFARLLDLGLLEMDGAMVSLTYTGRLFADEVGRTFYSVPVRARMKEIDSDLISTTWPTLVS